MADEILYRTEHKLSNVDYYQIQFSTPKGLETLEWKPGEVGSLVFILYSNRVIADLIPNLNKDGFYGSSGTSVKLFNSTTTDQVIDYIRRRLQLYKQNKSLTSAPRAIISTSYEAEFQEVAAALGLKPRKLKVVN